MTKILSSKPVLNNEITFLSPLFWSLKIGICNLFAIWCLEFEIFWFASNLLLSYWNIDVYINCSARFLHKMYTKYPHGSIVLLYLPFVL